MAWCKCVYTVSTPFSSIFNSISLCLKQTLFACTSSPWLTVTLVAAMVVCSYHIDNFPARALIASLGIFWRFGQLSPKQSSLEVQGFNAPWANRNQWGLTLISISTSQTPEEQCRGVIYTFPQRISVGIESQLPEWQPGQ